MWRHEATRRLYLILWLVLSLSLVVPAPQLSTFFGFYLLLKVMVIDFIFFKFPRLRAKYDTSSLIWETLPTDADLNARQKVDQVYHGSLRSVHNFNYSTSSFVFLMSRLGCRDSYCRNLIIINPGIHHK